MKKPSSLLELLAQPLRFKVLPKGKLPKRGHDTDAAVDCYIRAIVKIKRSRRNPNQRETVFDFSRKMFHSSKCKAFRKNGTIGRDREGYYWRVLPGKTLSIGLGFNVEIAPGLAGLIVPRGSSVAREESYPHLACLNEDVPMDAGFIGEPWSEIRNDGEEPFLVRKKHRLTQLMIVPVWTGRILRTKGKLKGGSRGTKSNGSSLR